MPGTAIAARGVIELAWVAARISDQVVHALDRNAPRKLRVQHQDIGHAGYAGDGREVAQRVVRHLGVQPRVDGVCSHGAHHQGLAVWCGLGNQIGADIAACTGPVIDDHGAQRVFHALGQGARHGVEGAASRVGHDEPNRLRLGLRFRGQEQTAHGDTAD